MVSILQRLTRRRLLPVAEEVFAWSFALALILAAVDWVRPLTIAPFFNVGWLIALAVVALGAVVLAS